MKFSSPLPTILGAILLFIISCLLHVYMFLSHLVVAGAQTFSDNADAINKFATTVAIVVGGVSAYIRFFYGQTYSFRIELKIKPKVTEIAGEKVLQISVEAKNVGTSTVHFEDLSLYPKDERTLREVAEYRRRQKKKKREMKEEWLFDNAARLFIRKGRINTSKKRYYPIEWGFKDDKSNEKERDLNIPIFTDHEMIRAGETIFDTVSVGVEPPLPAIFQAEAVIVSRRGILKSQGNKWSVKCTFSSEEKGTDKES